MISLHRQRTAKAVQVKYRGDKKHAMDKQLLLAQRAALNNPAQKHEFLSAYWKTAKKQLIKESNGKCAYCEANVQVVAHGDVEHYRPKDIYWWLAYTYDNYLYACQICNQTYKSNHFPIAAIALPSPGIVDTSSDEDIAQWVGKISPDPLGSADYPLARYVNEHRAEQALLLNPYFDDPTVYFAYAADDLIKEVTIIPTQPQYAGYVKAAEDFYGINRLELKNARYAVYRMFRVLKAAYAALPDQEPTKTEVKNTLAAMLAPQYLFAGMNRYFDQQL